MLRPSGNPRPDRRVPNSRLRTNRQDGHAIQRVARALRIEIEAAHRDDFVAPPFDAGRRRHPEAVDIENPATNAVLGDFGDCRDALISHHIETLRGVGESPFLFIDFDHEPRLLESRRHRRPLGAGSRCSDQDTHRPAQQRLERLDALARELVMRLLGAQRLALRLECRHVGSKQCLQIREPALPVRRGGSDDGKDALRQGSSERGDQHGGTRAGKPPYTNALSGRGYPSDQGAGSGKVLEPLEQKVERHQRVRVATPNSAAASSSARRSSRPLASARRVPENRSAANRSTLSTAARSLPPSAAVTSAGVAGVRSDSRGSGPNTVGPTVSAPRERNSTRGAPSAAATSASPITMRLTSASTNGTKPGAAGNAVHAVSSRLPSSTTPPDLTSHGSPLTVASTPPAPCSPAPPAPSSRYRRTTETPLRAARPGDAIAPGVPS